MAERRIGWKRKLAIGLGGLLLLAGMGFGAALYFGWAIPPVEVVEPGSTGRRITEDGLLANYYPGRGEGPRPAILMLGGSEGGITEGARRNALVLQAEGFSVLQLSYYRAPGQPPHLEMIPLEYFSGAVSWLQRQIGVDRGRIGVIGVSKGAEAALLLATRDPRIRAVVAGAPSSVAWQGSSFDSTQEFNASWSERGSPIEFIRFGRYKWWTDMGAVLTEALATLPQHPGAAIPVERTTAQILLICGEADIIWPACPMSRQVAERARRQGRPAVTVLAYPGVGHGALGQPLRAGDTGYDQLKDARLATNQARTESWPRVIAFLKAALEAQAAASTRGSRRPLIHVGEDIGPGRRASA